MCPARRVRRVWLGMVCWLGGGEMGFVGRAIGGFRFGEGPVGGEHVWLVGAGLVGCALVREGQGRLPGGRRATWAVTLGGGGDLMRISERMQRF